MSKSNFGDVPHERFGGAVEQLKDEVLTQVKEELHQLVEVRAENPEDAGITDIWIAGQPLGKIIENNRKSVSQVEEKVEEESGDGSSSDEPRGSTDQEEAPENNLTPLERITLFEDDSKVVADVTPSVERARTIFENFRSWSNKVPAGRVIGNKTNLRKLINTARKETIEWQQVYRACRKVEEWTNGKIQFKKTDRAGWILVAEDSRMLLSGTG